MLFEFSTQKTVVLENIFANKFCHCIGNFRDGRTFKCVRKDPFEYARVNKRTKKIHLDN